MPTLSSKEKSRKQKSEFKHTLNKKYCKNRILTLFIFSQKKAAMQDGFRKNKSKFISKAGLIYSNKKYLLDDFIEIHIL